MTKNTEESNSVQLKGESIEPFGKLTDDDLDVLVGKRDQLLSRLQERHGITRAGAEKQVAARHEKNPNTFFELY